MGIEVQVSSELPRNAKIGRLVPACLPFALRLNGEGEVPS
jgi:hypothetical protein